MEPHLGSTLARGLHFVPPCVMLSRRFLIFLSDLTSLVLIFISHDIILKDEGGYIRRLNLENHRRPYLKRHCCELALNRREQHTGLDEMTLMVIDNVLV